MQYSALLEKSVEETIAYLGTQFRSLEKGTLEKNAAKAIVRIKNDPDSEEIGDITKLVKKRFGFDPRKTRVYEAARVFEGILNGEIMSDEKKFDAVAIGALTHLSAILNLEKFAGIRDVACLIFAEDKKPLAGLMKLRKSVTSPAKSEDNAPAKSEDKAPAKSEDKAPAAPTLVPEISGNEDNAPEAPENTLVIDRDNWVLTREVGEAILDDIEVAREASDVETLQNMTTLLMHLAQAADNAAIKVQAADKTPQVA